MEEKNPVKDCTIIVFMLDHTWQGLCGVCKQWAHLFWHAQHEWSYIQRLCAPCVCVCDQMKTVQNKMHQVFAGFGVCKRSGDIDGTVAQCYSLGWGQSEIWNDSE